MALIHGQDPSGYLLPLLVDASGNVILSQPVQVQGTNLDKLLSINDPIAFLTFTVTLAAGTNNLAVFTVPAGFIYHITNVGMVYIGTITNVSLQLNAVIKGVSLPLESYYSVVSAQYRYRTVDLWFTAGDTLTFSIYNATLNDDAYSSIIGYKLHTT